MFVVSTQNLFITKRYLVISAVLTLSAPSLASSQNVVTPLKTAVSGSSNEALPLSASEKGLSFSDRLLAKADGFYERGMLLWPEDDNAYIRYRAVKIIQPDNEAAQAGLDAILVHELALVKDMLAKSKYTSAEEKRAELEKLFPDEPSLEQLRGDIEKAVADYKQRMRAHSANQAENGDAVKAGGEEPDDRIYLDPAELKQKDEGLITRLQEIAKVVQDTDRGVLIFARSDAEGRWVYQQMRKATPNYRIRGDIRIGKPAIKLLSSFEQ